MNKVRFTGGLICASSSIDQATNALSVFNVIDQIDVQVKREDVTQSADTSIIVPISFQVITMWKRTDVKDLGKDVSPRIGVDLLDGEGKILKTNEFDLNIPAAYVRSRYVLNVQGLPVNKSGEYCFCFKPLNDLHDDEGDVMARLCLDINLTLL